MSSTSDRVMSLSLSKDPSSATNSLIQLGKAPQKKRKRRADESMIVLLVGRTLDSGVCPLLSGTKSLLLLLTHKRLYNALSDVELRICTTA